MARVELMFVLEEPPPAPPPEQLLKELSALFDQLVALDRTALAPEHREALLVGLARQSGRAAALQALLARDADLAGDWTAVGATSGRSWVSQLTNTSISATRHQLHIGHALDRLRAVARAALEGDISWSATEVLAT